MPARPLARHRAARRPLTALDDLASASADGMAAAGKRSAAAVITSGLVMSMSGTPAFAAPITESTALTGSVDTARLTQGARAVLEQQVVAPSNVEWTFEAPAVTAVAPAPEPEPEPVVTASRSRARGAAPAATATATATATAEPTVAVPASANGNAIVEIAARYVGVPYVYGGTTPNGFDCSGFTSYVFAQVGISLPRTSSAQRNVGTVVSRADALPGDLIWSPGHIAIYAGNGLQVDAPRPGKTIQIREIWQSSPIFIRVG
ncbi:C40 family peptidase [Cellulomonas humilata]|uniref:C40 family peptidase n=1 Tax=Cellulomonas humilata TaxID=144055 RepID=A0A7Y6A0M5_9CELL|nr:C40 family peptidase [Cellulomonas humilata]NUU17606.1 C40 family peptidase [Cellulomonas humilata]